MKVIIAGSRNLDNYLLVAQAMQRCGYEVTEVVSGCATGIDTLGERWARSNNLPKNRDVGKLMNKYIDMGYKMVIWPDSVPGKDINEM